MLLAAAIIWPLTIFCGVLLWLGPSSRARQALDLARRNGIFMLSRVPFAFLGAGFAATLLPQDLVTTWLGGESGWTGILIASVVGAFVPSGALISFPIAFAMWKAGVGMPQLIAFLSAWAVLPVHRLIAWDIPLLGGYFSVIRLVASLVLPPLSGLLAAAIVSL